MKTSELRTFTSDELDQKMKGFKKELLDLRILASGGKLDKPHRVRIIRHDVARILTILKEQKKNA